MAMMWLPDVATRPDVVELIGNGSLWCLGDNLNVAAQRSGNGDTRVAVTLRETEALVVYRLIRRNTTCSTSSPGGVRELSTWSQPPTMFRCTKSLRCQLI
jgi:hypothetical protein